jgi:cytochrome c oxidase subunit 2
MTAHARSITPVLAVLGAAAGLGGCAEVQSVVSPAGEEARRIAELWWIAFIGATAILVGVAIVAAVALVGPEGWRRPLSGDAIIIGGGVVLPVVLLSALLGHGMFVTQIGAAVGAGDEPVRISVVGERWWWRVVYTGPDGETFERANEIRVPVGRPVRLELTSADVIHSFWAPRLAGKLDMIPGRTNTLTLKVEEPGVSRGQCAEYCGGAHALMSFYVVAMTAEEFDAWLASAGGDARAPQGDEARYGMELFLQSGCGACHAVRGTRAAGEIGPDLTRVGARLSIGAATLLADREGFSRWIALSHEIKPDNLMPPYRIFDDAELAALSAYLEGLR